RRLATRRRPELAVTVDPELAAFSAWYELFPRSASPDPDRPGTLADVEARLPGIAEMGFDVVYLPPVHPIGRAFRKGPNNSENGDNGAVGSPWAIGGPEGGHTAIHPDLGTIKDFRHLVRTARKLGLEIAMDLAYNASPDHPYVDKHPEWFRARPDGTIQYSENPPKRYQDIYPFDFESEHWQALWNELRKIVTFWIDQGVRIFRVDNPHTKPFGFWEWLIEGLKKDYPELIFLSEAFTRPKVMHRLAKLGFSQSYTYFAWRNTAEELREYLVELTRTEEQEYFRPNFWTNTQDILTEALQTGGRAASAMRVVLAATLCTNYGIFGPSFELVETTPLVAGREEYLNSEKYEVRHWDHEREGNLCGLIGRLNHLRRQHAPLQQMRNLRFLRTDNEQLLAYAKSNDDGSDPVVIIVNLDPHWKQSGWVELPVRPLDGAATYQVSDVLNDRCYDWQESSWNFIELDPAETPAHILVTDRPLLLPEG
ncbi:MAG TPA: alpha-amylase family glycosyl hydrolase, partial [Candidatus Dormibacteraeota bacterium]|nr:alpha-amylase family glycosyl hydrolase [Candidatus Dormibacteraeota bacterium]